MTPNPVESINEDPVSQSTFTIAGILTTVHGLEELPPQSPVACLWLLHPRNQTHQCMSPIAAQAIRAWNSRKSDQGLIAVSFDQRNHGSRQVDAVSNEAWRNGNPRHAQDMFSIYHGTATDTSLLLSYLPAYISLTPNQHLVLGISLGGHATWHCILHEPRISTAVSIIGCPDYTALMQQRAEKSKLQTWGPDFIGSSDFPQALVEAVRQWDPAGSLMRRLSNAEAPTPIEKERLRGHLWANLQGKRLLNLSGGADKLVPYECGQDFLTFLKKAVQEDPRLAFELEDLVFDGVGHETTPKMAEIAVNFICDSLASDRPVTSRVKTSKI
ncbi:Alpha/Beta hydrolase protein [Phyllosticta citriasiana]|uniref:Alpha/Beta hydrolase protein n=1 Tax=Phyllosticta citriasiana TaxID=595635 RepID=A0ABR1KMW5_9PEZI